MIKVKIFRNDSGNIYGFEVFNHGQTVVCAAVSVLCLNTVNSIEKFTDDKFIVKDDPSDWGYLFFEIPAIKEGNLSDKSDLLLKSLVLGLRGIESEYSRDIKVFDKEEGKTC